MHALGFPMHRYVLGGSFTEPNEYGFEENQVNVVAHRCAVVHGPLCRRASDKRSKQRCDHQPEEISGKDHPGKVVDGVMRSARGGFLLFARHGCFIERKHDLRLIVFFLFPN